MPAPPRSRCASSGNRRSSRTPRASAGRSSRSGASRASTGPRARLRKIDFHQRLTALVDGVEIGGSDDAKGYGGFSPRVVMPPDIRFTGAQGIVTPIENAVGASPWMDVSGSYGASGKSGLTVLTHPTTTGFPQPWILRARNSMQNAVYPGRQPVAIPRDRPVILRYRIVLHRGELAAAEIGRLQAEYAGESIAQ